MKPLVRWVIGDVSVEGFDCLRHSISCWRKIYGTTFDLMVCHNNCRWNINSLNVPTLDQTKISGTGKPCSTAWKLYPARLRLDAHEIILDNDLVIFGSIEQLDDYLNSQDMFIVSHAVHRRYGRFDSLVKSDMKINTGFIGYPPGFDLSKHIPNIDDWEHFDEQGLIGSILSNKTVSIIPLDEISVCYNRYSLGRSGVHFVGLNGGSSRFWNQYLYGKLL